MIEQYRKELLSKIHNYDFNFNEEEIILIAEFPEFKPFILKGLAAHPECWNELSYSTLDDDDLENITPEICDSFWLNLMKYRLAKEGILEDDFVEMVLSMFDFKQETIDAIEQLRKTPNNSNTISYDKIAEIRIITIELIEKLYNEKRFDLIAKINPQSFINDDAVPIIEKIIEEYPYEMYDLPEVFLVYKKNLGDKLERLSINNLISLYHSDSNSWSTQRLMGSPEIYLNIIFSKLKEKKFSEPTLLDFDYEKIKHVLYKYQKEIIELTYENKILNFLPYILVNYLANKEKTTDYIIAYLNQTEKKDEKIEQAIYGEILKNEAIIDTLIEKGMIAPLLKNRVLTTYPDKKAIVINLIKNRHSNYEHSSEELQLHSYHFYEPEIIETMITSYNIKTINLSELSIGIFFNDKLKTSILDCLIKILNNYPHLKLKDIDFIRTNEEFSKIAPLLLERKMYKELFTIVNNCLNNSEMIKEEFINLNSEFLIKTSYESLYFFQELLNNKASLIIENSTLRKGLFQNEYTLSKIINYINHHEQYSYFYNHEIFLELLEIFSKKYNISQERLLKFEETFGPKLIRYIDNENVQEILKWDEETFNKLISLFPKEAFTMVDLESSYDSLKQYEFSKKHPNEISIFPNILHAIEDNDKQALDSYIEKIYHFLDKEFFEKINKKYDLPEEYNQNNPKLFVTFVIAKIKHSEGEKKEKYINILHLITDYYILKKREEYRASYDMEKELELPFTYERKSFDNEYLKYLIKNRYSETVQYTIDEFGNKKNECIYLDEYLQRKMKSYGLSDLQIRDALRYYSFPRDLNSPYISPLVNINEIKQNFKFVVRAIQEISKEQPTHIIFTEQYKEESKRNMDLDNVKRIYDVGEVGIDVFDILATLKLDVFKDCVLSHEEIYLSLEKLMKKRKLHQLPYCLKKILNTKNINVSDDFTNISAFLSYYAQIYQKEKSTLASNNKPTDNIMINLINILINAEVYSSVSSVYSQVLGDVDSKLIKSNPGPNSASYKLANDQRLKEAVKLTKQNFERDSVTVPTFNNVVDLDENKKMRIVVGNFTHPSNLTHGERTGACMRIGGVGESLFYFCLKNQNGFHIRFEDPKTGKYISRVSGFRNGNTVFLNELRYSCDQELYSNADVVAACRKAAELLIEQSKHSSTPIDNVVIHRAYATSNIPDKDVVLDKTNIKEGIPHFYSDVDNNVIVLATNAKDKDFVPLNFDKSKIPSYLPARNQPLISNDIQAVTSQIIRVDTIKRILNGENYEYISPLEFKNGLTYAIVNDDWYIYIDEEGIIHSDVIDRDPRAKEELAEYLIKLETELNQGSTKKENGYGI